MNDDAAGVGVGETSQDGVISRKEALFVAVDRTPVTSRFLLSFDCEGKWGMADDPSMIGQHPISDSSIRWAYELIFKILEQHEIPATFGVVGLFASDYEQFRLIDDELGRENLYEDWFRFPKKAFQERNFEGWFFPDLVNRIRTKGFHEVSSHGLTHLPFQAPFVSEKLFEYELRSMNELMKTKEATPRTMIYPRNQIAYTELLPKYGIQGFRECDLQNSAYGSKFTILRDEFNLLKQSEAESKRTHPVPIPSGIFLNWRHGPRRLIPRQVTLQRWSHVLDHAQKSGGVAHLWLHPHNLITARDQADLFERCIEMVAQRVRNKVMKAMTFTDYCTSVSNGASKSENN